MVKNAAFPREEFDVEALLKKRAKNGRVEYKVKWLHYSISESTWEPLSNLQGSMDLVREFEEREGRRFAIAKKAAKPSAQKDEVRRKQRLSRLDVEDWHVEKSGVRGTFRTHRISSVARSIRDCGGKLSFEVVWEGDDVEKSVVSLEDFRKHEPKKLIDYLSQFV